jgi:hypothetical protein
MTMKIDTSAKALSLLPFPPGDIAPGWTQTGMLFQRKTTELRSEAQEGAAPTVSPPYDDVDTIGSTAIAFLATQDNAVAFSGRPQFVDVMFSRAPKARVGLAREVTPAPRSTFALRIVLWVFYPGSPGFGPANWEVPGASQVCAENEICRFDLLKSFGASVSPAGICVVPLILSNSLTGDMGDIAMPAGLWNFASAIALA